MKMCFSLPIAHLIFFSFLFFSAFLFVAERLYGLLRACVFIRLLRRIPDGLRLRSLAPREVLALGDVCCASPTQKNCNEFADFCAENLHDLGGVGVAREFVLRCQTLHCLKREHCAAATRYPVAANAAKRAAVLWRGPMDCVRFSGVYPTTGG